MIKKISEFQVGDVIQCVDIQHTNGRLVVGNCYTVVENDKGFETCRIIDESGTEGGWMTRRFILNKNIIVHNLLKDL